MAWLSRFVQEHAGGTVACQRPLRGSLGTKAKQTSSQGEAGWFCASSMSPISQDLPKLHRSQTHCVAGCGAISCSRPWRHNGEGLRAPLLLLPWLLLQQDPAICVGAAQACPVTEVMPRSQSPARFSSIIGKELDDQGSMEVGVVTTRDALPPWKFYTHTNGWRLQLNGAGAPLLPQASFL